MAWRAADFSPQGRCYQGSASSKDPSTPLQPEEVARSGGGGGLGWYQMPRLAKDPPAHRGTGRWGPHPVILDSREAGVTLIVQKDTGVTKPLGFLVGGKGHRASSSEQGQPQNPVDLRAIESVIYPHYTDQETEAGTSSVSEAHTPGKQRSKPPRASATGTAVSMRSPNAVTPAGFCPCSPSPSPPSSFSAYASGPNFPSDPLHVSRGDFQEESLGSVPVHLTQGLVRP